MCRTCISRVYTCISRVYTCKHVKYTCIHVKYTCSQSPTKYYMRKKILPRNHQMSILELLILENLSLELKVFTEPFWRKLTLKLPSIFAFTIVFWPGQGTVVEILGEACWTFWGCKSIFLH